MTDLSRRQILVGAAAVAAASAIPATVAPAIEAAAPAEIIPAWAVGTPGEFNWQHIVARTAEEAERIFRAEWIGDNCEDEEDGPCGECDACCLDVEATRVKSWDGLGTTTSADWLRADMGSCCTRCGSESHKDAGAQIVGEDAICEDCLTLADWGIIDPKHAAELRAEDEERSRRHVGGAVRQGERS